MEFKTWDIDDIDSKIKEEDQKYKDKNKPEYDDNYYQQHSNYCAFQAVASWLACGLDYTDRGISKIDTIDALKDKMRTEYDPNYLSSIEQRLSNVTFQHPMATY